MMTASDNGVAKGNPAVSGWTTDGDVHKATIPFVNDGKYTLAVAYTDMAGNNAVSYAEQTFFVDKTKPTINITNIGNNSANKGDVAPSITYSDTNFDGAKATITLTGANRNSVELLGTKENIQNGGSFKFANFKKEKDVDDIYTLTVKLTDRAGNEESKSVTFSVNRFGSTYAVSDATKAILNKYIQKGVDVEFTEINVDPLKTYTLKYSKDGNIVNLEEGKDYTVQKTGGNGEWSKYYYTIKASNFSEEGNYIITLYSEDQADNSSDNKTKGREIKFSVDKTAPTCIISDLQDMTTYDSDEKNVTFSVKDNLNLTNIKVMLDGNLLKEWDTKAIIESNGNFSFSIPSSNNRQSIQIIYTDAAGNEGTTKIKKFLVTSNKFVQYYQNPYLLFGSIGGVLLIAAIYVFSRFRRNPKVHDGKIQQ